MKKVLLLAAVFAFTLVSCESVMRAGLSGALSAAYGSSGPSYSEPSYDESAGSGGYAESSSSRAPLPADFQNGDVLVSEGKGDGVGADFFVSRVLTAATPATKNQTEVIYVSDGSKNWVNIVAPTRKVAKDELRVGMEVFYLTGWSGYDNIGIDSYRKDGWRLGRVTSTEELYKNLVEIDGYPYYWNYVRVKTAK